MTFRELKQFIDKNPEILDEKIQIQTDDYQVSDVTSAMYDEGSNGGWLLAKLRFETSEIPKYYGFDKDKT